MDFQTRYEFNPKTDLLGKGGFSKVYRATDTLLERTVALKFFTGTASDKYQILNEIKKVIRFEHPNLCKYYDVAVLTSTNILGETERIEVGIMEYIDAGDFKTYTRKNPEYIDKLLIDVLRGLAYLHKHGIAHRDLKPQNILIKIVDDEPVSKITDFGISKLIDSDDNNPSALLGTIEYMAPEQFNPKKYGINGRITTNLDLWSFGLLVYEALCHKPFFGSRSSGISAEQVMANILSDTSLEEAETLPSKYREIVKRCLVKNASERVKNALELIPLFEEKLNSYQKIETGRETETHKVNAEETQVIEFLPKEAPEETQVIDPAPETTAEQTQLIETEPDVKEEAPVLETLPEDTAEETQFIPEPLTEETTIVEPATENTQVIEHGPDATEEIIQETEPLPETPAEQTQTIEPIPEATAENTEVIDLASKEKEEETQEIENNLIDPDEQDEVAGKQPVSHEKKVREIKKEKPAPKPIKKIVLLSSVAVLLVILFLVYPFSKPAPPAPSTDTTSVQQQPVLPPPDLAPELVKISGGSFLTGDSLARVGDFYLGKYEVTIDQFKQFIGETNYVTSAEQKGSSSVYEGGRWIAKENVNWRHDVHGNLADSNTKEIPVVHVSWNDANAYCKWLSQKKKEHYRLPTGAEWEFAAKGGNQSKDYVYSGSNDINAVAWCKENSGGSIHPVGKKLANELGIYDMSGNASEWCIDRTDDVLTPDSAKLKFVRGGAWGAEMKFCRNTNKKGFPPETTGGNIGFRICKAG